MGQQMGNMDNMGNLHSSPAMGTNRGSPSKRGYYRPRQYKPNQQKAQYQARRGPNQGGQAYIAAPMGYDQPGPYGMPQYAQPYPQNIHMAAAINPNNPNPANPSGVGSKRNKSATNWEQ